MKIKRPYIQISDSYAIPKGTSVVGTVYNQPIKVGSLIRVCTILFTDLGLVSHIEKITKNDMEVSEVMVNDRAEFYIKGLPANLLRPGMIVEVIEEK